MPVRSGGARALNILDHQQPILPVPKTVEEWTEQGIALGRTGRVLEWAVGAWWNSGEKYGERVKIVTAPDWEGPAYATCRQYGSVAARFDLSRRSTTLSFGLHAEAVKLASTEEQDEMLEEARKQVEETGEAPTVLEFRQKVKARRRSVREIGLAAATEKASASLGRRLYSVILADCPWSFAVRSDKTGLDRSASNHYPTMTTAAIAAMEIPAARDCVLFLWATVPMLPEALDVMKAWGFIYRSNMAWVKPTPGTGYWFRNAHEHLLLGVRGDVPAPAPGLQRLSWFQANRGRHSEKPDCVHMFIEQMFPSQPKLEMFARKQREGWSSFGNQIEEG